MIDIMVTPIVDFITSPLGQIVFWGTVTIYTFLYTLITWLNCEQEDLDKEWRCVTAILVSMFWIVNVTMWFAASAKWMLLSDLFFVGISLLIFRNMQLRWGLHLARLYSLSFVFDVLLWNGLPQPPYAWLSNFVYALQLLTILGYVQWTWSDRLVRKLRPASFNKNYYPQG